VRSDEVVAYKKAHGKTLATEATSLTEAIDSFTSDGYVVIEDIINLAKREERVLRKLLNYDAHHNRLRIVCVAHLLFRTSLLSLVPLFNFTIFTLNTAGRSLIKQAGMYSFYLESTRSAAWAASFANACKRWGEHGGYVYICCKEVKLYHRDEFNATTPLELDVEIAKKEGLKRTSNSKKGALKARERVDIEAGETATAHLIDRFACCFKNHEQAAIAVSIFSIVANVIVDEPSFRAFDLTFAFKQKRHPGTVRRISLVDYVDTLIDAHPLTGASRDFKVLHRYLSDRCKIPLLFVLNPHFRLGRDDEASSNVEEETSSDDDDDDDDGDDDDDNDENRRNKRIVGQEMERVGR